MSKDNSQLSAIAEFFEVEKYGSDTKTEVLAGVTTFVTLAYIIVVNPAILSQAIEVQGHSQQEVIQMLAVITILAGFVGTLVMALYAKRPFGLAPGMGSNAFIAFTVVAVMGIPWQTALAAVFVEGLIFILLTAIGARKYVIDLIPVPVKKAVGAGIGLFLLFLGLQEMNIVVADETSLVALGDVATDPVALLALAGIFFTFILWARGIRGSIIIGIILTGLTAWVLTFAGVVPQGVLVPENVPSAQYDITPIAGAFLEGFADIEPVTFLIVLFTLFVLDFFSTAGTLIGVSQVAGFLDEEGNLPGIDKALMADAIGTTVGSMLGTTTVSTFVESSTGIEQGGRTGMTALVIAALFLVSLVAVPLVAALPTYAAYVALIIVGLIMLQGVLEIKWDDPAWTVSGGLTIVIMPLTFNIAYGLAAGIIAYPIVKTASDGLQTVKAGHWILALVFVAYIYVQTGGILG